MYYAAEICNSEPLEMDWNLLWNHFVLSDGLKVMVGTKTDKESIGEIIDTFSYNNQVTKAE